jgi:PleD family two-component response regulator
VTGDRLLAALASCRHELPVLVVGEDADLRALLRRILEREGYAVVEADSGRSALDRVREPVPGAVLLDLTMPEVAVRPRGGSGAVGDNPPPFGQFLEHTRAFLRG